MWAQNGKKDWWAQIVLETFWLANMDCTTYFQRGCNMFTAYKLVFQLHHLQYVSLR